LQFTFLDNKQCPLFTLALCYL